MKRSIQTSVKKHLTDLEVQSFGLPQIGKAHARKYDSPGYFNCRSNRIKTKLSCSQVQQDIKFQSPLYKIKNRKMS